MTLPPYARMLGLTVEPGDEGTAPVLLLPFAEGVLGRPGFLHGGAIGGLLEMAAQVALEQAMATAHDLRIRPATMTVDFLRGGRDRPTRARGTVTRLGTRVANVEAIAWQENPATPIAIARLNCLVERG